VNKVLSVLTILLSLAICQAQTSPNQEVIELDTTALFFDQSFDTVDFVVVGTVTEEEGVSEHDGHYHSDNDTTVNAISVDSNTNVLVRKVLEAKTYWTSINPKYSVFDSMTVNPYRTIYKNFKDTVPLILYGQEVSGEERVRWWSMPLTRKHEITSVFGPRWSRYHYGTDLRVAIGDSVLSCFDGVVRISKYNRGGYGHYVLIRHHNGLETLYGHLSEKIVKVGQEVRAGELIGLAGNTGRSTGPHLHFEIRYTGNAVNPTSIYSFKGDSIKIKINSLTPQTFKYVKEKYARKYYRVRRGDTLYRIARRYRVSIGQICRLNRISRKTTLRIGRRLRVK